jgi:hypothetical protein
MSFRTITLRRIRLAVWLVAIFVCVSPLLIYRHDLARMSDPMIDLLLYIGGGVVGIALTVIGGHLATDKRGYRLAFYILGFVGSGLLVAAGVRGYRAALAAVPPKDIVMEAVNKSNEHTDTEIAMVRGDLKDATAHSDKQIGMVRDDLKGTMSAVTDLLSKTETNLNASIGKVGKPDPPERPKITFTLLKNGNLPESEFPLLVLAQSPNSDNVFSIDFLARNTSNAPAENAELWIEVCQECSFNKEPTNFERAPGAPETERHRQWALLNAGVATGTMTIEVKLKGNFQRFPITFAYACKGCDAPSKNRTDATILVSK